MSLSKIRQITLLIALIGAAASTGAQEETRPQKLTGLDAVSLVAADNAEVIASRIIDPAAEMTSWDQLNLGYKPHVNHIFHVNLPAKSRVVELAVRISHRLGNEIWFCRFPIGLMDDSEKCERFGS